MNAMRMKRIIVLVLVAMLSLFMASTGEAKGRTYKRIYIRHPSHAIHVRRPKSLVTSREQRSSAARQAFIRSLGLKQEPKGYVIDHIIPLCAGGADAPSNMHLQTVEAAKVKDRWEKVYCRSHYLGAHH